MSQIVSLLLVTIATILAGASSSQETQPPLPGLRVILGAMPWSEAAQLCASEGLALAPAAAVTGGAEAAGARLAEEGVDRRLWIDGVRDRRRCSCRWELGESGIGGSGGGGGEVAEDWHLARNECLTIQPPATVGFADCQQYQGGALCSRPLPASSTFSPTGPTPTPVRSAASAAAAAAAAAGHREAWLPAATAALAVCLLVIVALLVIIAAQRASSSRSPAASSSSAAGAAAASSGGPSANRRHLVGGVGSASARQVFANRRTAATAPLHLGGARAAEEGPCEIASLYEAAICRSGGGSGCGGCSSSNAADTMASHKL